MPTSEKCDLAEIMRLLDSHIQASMTSLYDAQTASHNVHVGESLHRQEFRSIRKLLRRSWQHVMQFLKESHAYGSDVEFLGTSASKEKLDDIAQFIEDMSNSTRRLTGAADRLLEEHKTVSTSFEDRKSVFDDCIMETPKIKPTWPFNLWRKQSKEDLPPPESSNLYKQLYSKLYPDGAETIREFERSLEGYHSCILLLHQFWQDQGANCKRILELCRTSDLHGLMREANANVNEWRKYQPAIMTAIAGISKSIDAVMTDAPIARLGGNRVAEAATSASSSNPRKRRKTKALLFWKRLQRRLVANRNN